MQPVCSAGPGTPGSRDASGLDAVIYQRVTNCDTASANGIMMSLPPWTRRRLTGRLHLNLREKLELERFSAGAQSLSIEPLATLHYIKLIGVFVVTENICRIPTPKGRVLMYNRTSAWACGSFSLVFWYQWCSCHFTQGPVVIATANESSSSFFRLLNSPLRRTHFNVVGAVHTCTRTQNQLMSVIEDYAVSTAEDVHLDRVCSLLTCSSSFRVSAKTSYAIVHSSFARNYVICSIACSPLIAATAVSLCVNLSKLYTDCKLKRSQVYEYLITLDREVCYGSEYQSIFPDVQICRSGLSGLQNGA